MYLTHRSWNVFLYQLHRSIAAPRVILLFVILGIYICSTVQPASDFSSYVKIAASPWVFPHLTNDFICQLVVMAGVIFLFCDAPFEGESHMYILFRSGRLAWSSGHVLYIITMSLIYVVFIVAISMVPLLPNIQWSWNWGKIWGTLARTNAGAQFGMQFRVNDYLIGAFTPRKAMLLSFLLEWACTCWLGLLIYFVNAITGKMTGTFLAAGFVLLDIMIANEWTRRAYAFSPITLAQLYSFSGANQDYGITLKYASFFFAITIIILALLCSTNEYIKELWTGALHRHPIQKLD